MAQLSSFIQLGWDGLGSKQDRLTQSECLFKVFSVIIQICSRW